MKKKYLKTVEDVLVLKNTDTKIYSEKDEGCYYQFVKGVLCCFSKSSDHVCIGDWVTLKMNLYILEEEPEQEASEKDVGKLCWFFDKDTFKVVGILKEVLSKDDCFPFRSDYGIPSKNCRPLTKKEIKEFMEKAE